jgi:hypothetical protein
MKPAGAIPHCSPITRSSRRTQPTRYGALEDERDGEQSQAHRQGDTDAFRQTANYYLKGNVRRLQYEMTGAALVSRFRVTLEQVIEDQEPNAEITTGLTYRRLTQRDPNDFAVKVFRLLREEL